MELPQILILVLTFLILLGIGVPVAWTLAIASLLTRLCRLETLTALAAMAQQVMTGLDSVTLLAIRFFILAGQLMNQGGIATRLIRVAKRMIGSLPGGLAHIKVVAATLFGDI